MTAPKPLTLKQEAFALKVAEGERYADAYRSAYDAENMDKNSIRVEASRLMADPNVALMVMGLQEEARERSLVTVEGLTKELNEDRVLARQEGQSSAAISAVMAKAKLHGLLIDKSHIKHEGMTVTITGPEGDL